MYYVAKSYSNFIYDESKAYQKSGKLYVHATCKCDRCTNGVFVTRVENGKPVPHPAYGGVCLKCGGEGKITKEIRLYTESEYAATERAAAAREAKKENERLAKIEQDKANSEKNRIEWMKRNNIGEDGMIYCIAGDTYSIKDDLKAQGCRFSPVLKWYSATPIELPEGFSLIPFKFDDLYEWNPMTKMAYFYQDAQEKVEKAFAQAAGPSLSEYVGEVGDRIRNLTAVVKSIKGFSSIYGYNNIYEFKNGDNILIWITQKELSLNVGDIVDLTGTVKAHSEYKAVCQTQLSRCIIKKIQ